MVIHRIFKIKSLFVTLNMHGLICTKSEEKNGEMFTFMKSNPFLSAMTEWTTSGNNFEMKFDEQEKSNFVRLSK